jgi:hypothetical protein
VTRGESELLKHLKSGRFLAGAARGRWRLLVEVRAKDGRNFVLRFDCIGYPETPPTATFWDMQANRQLEAHRWPSGGRVSQCFNPSWKQGTALYLPCDRQSVEGHPGWIHEYPWLIWKAQRGLLQYLEAVREMLYSKELICVPT